MRAWPLGFAIVALSLPGSGFARGEATPNQACDLGRHKPLTSEDARRLEADQARRPALDCAVRQRLQKAFDAQAPDDDERRAGLLMWDDGSTWTLVTVPYGAASKAIPQPDGSLSIPEQAREHGTTYNLDKTNLKIVGVLRGE